VAILIKVCEKDDLLNRIPKKTKEKVNFRI